MKKLQLNPELAAIAQKALRMTAQLYMPSTINNTILPLIEAQKTIARSLPPIIKELSPNILPIIQEMEKQATRNTPNLRALQEAIQKVTLSLPSHLKVIQELQNALPATDLKSHIEKKLTEIEEDIVKTEKAAEANKEVPTNKTSWRKFTFGELIAILTLIVTLHSHNTSSQYQERKLQIEERRLQFDERIFQSIRKLSGAQDKKVVPQNEPKIHITTSKTLCKSSFKKSAHTTVSIEEGQEVKVLEIHKKRAKITYFDCFFKEKITGWCPKKDIKPLKQYSQEKNDQSI